MNKFPLTTLNRRWRLLIEEAVYSLRAQSRGARSLHPAAQFQQLESRILMSATPAALPAADSAEAAMPVDESVQQASFAETEHASSSDHTTQEATVGQQAADENAVELVVIDPTADDYETLIADLESQTDRDLHILLLDGDRDGVLRITETLEELGSVSAIHLVSHGTDGEIRLGNSVLNQTTLNDYANELAVWRDVLNGDRDLLIYGCDLASSDSGQTFARSLSQMTLADIAASTDPTGADDRGGDWDLEYRHGDVQAGLAFTQSVQQNWDGLLASQTIFVTQTDDTVNGDVTSVGALLANDGGDGISLREAILAANKDTDTHTLMLSAGTYRLTNSGSNDSRGDLDIRKNLVIIGAGPDLTTIHGNGTDRVLEVMSADLQLERVTITGGDTGQKGGGIRADNSANLTLTDVVITGNVSSDDGGGVSIDGGFTANRVEFSNNTASDSGGAIYLNSADAGFLTNVTISGNTAGDGGALYSKNSTVTILNNTIAFNSSGITESGLADVRLQNTILANNTSGNSNSTLTSLGNNIDDDGSAGLSEASDQSNVDPLLDATLALNGGTTRTHALLAGSTAIDQANNAAAPTYDQRRYYRDGAADIGAYEANASPPLAPADIVLDSVLIPGGVNGAAGGTLTTVDSDSPTGHNYTVDDARFEIVAGVLRLKAGNTLNRDTEPSVSVEVTSTDVDDNELTKTFVLTVTHPPVIATDDTINVNADQPFTDTAPGFLLNDVITTNNVTAGAILNYDAGQDTDGDSAWNDTTGVAGFDWNFGTGVTRNDDPTTSRTGILGAWEFDGSATGGAINSDSFKDLPGDPTDSSATFEVWFRPTDATGKDLIFETGSAQSPSGTGMSLRTDGGNLEWLIYDPTNGNSVIVDISAEIASAEFIQVAGTITVTGSDTVMELFVNGTSVGSATIVGQTDWTDNQEAGGLGTIDGSVSVVSTGTDPFTGEIAIFRLYDSALTSADVKTNYDAVAGTPAGLTVDSIDTTGTTGSVTGQPTGEYSYDPDGQYDSLAAGQTATDTFDYVVTDGTQTQSATVTINITGVNDAPVLISDSTNYGTIEADETTSVVSAGTILTGLVTDVDAGAVQGVAITGAVGAGLWEYSVDGTNWQAFGSVSDTSALLLRSSDLVRYSGDGTSSETATVSYRAWDQTDTTAGQHGTLVDVTTFGTGGQSPFSLVENTGAVTVLPINASAVGNDDTYDVDEDTTLSVDDTPGWHNVGWSHRQQLFFNSAAQTSDLTNVPVLIVLHETAADAVNIDYSLTQNAGEDLRLLDANGDLLNYEIESWNETGYSYVWVQVPQIDGLSTTDSIWLYYGNGSAADAQTPNGVWDNNELAVLHLNGDAIDSTANGNDGIVSGTTSGIAQIGNGLVFDGINDRVNLGSGGNLDNIFVGGGTISAWINPSGWGENDYGRIADKAADEDGNGGWAIQIHGTSPTNGYIRIEYGFDGNRGVWETTAGSIELGSLQNVVISYDSSSDANTPVVYVDGVAQSITTVATPAGTAESDSANDLVIGNYSQNTTRTFDGTIDEFRITSGVWTADEVATAYSSENRSLITSGGVVKASGGVTANDTDPENDPLTVTLLTGPANADSFVLNADGSFDYTPDADFHGTDTFTYELDDGTDISGPITVTINVHAVGDKPTVTNSASNDGLQTTTGLVITQSPVDGAEVTHYQITGIIGGTVFLNDGVTVIAEGSFITVAEGAAGLKFTPAIGYSGDAFFDIQSSTSNTVDGVGGGIALATICVAPGNCSPEAQPIPDVQASEDDPLTQIPLDGYFTEPQGESLTYSLTVLSGNPAIFNTLSIHPETGLLSFLSKPDRHGSVQVRVTATDPVGAAGSSDFTLTVLPVQDRPTAGHHTYYLTDSRTLTTAAPGILSTAFDADGESLSAVLQTDVSVGILTLNPDGSFTYIAPDTFSGQVTFTYTADDGIEESAVATVTLEVGIGGSGGNGGNGGEESSGDGDAAGDSDSGNGDGDSDGNGNSGSDGGGTSSQDSAGAAAKAAQSTSDDTGGEESSDHPEQQVATAVSNDSVSTQEEETALFLDRSEAAGEVADSLQRSSDDEHNSLRTAIAHRQSLELARAQFFATFSQEGSLWRQLDNFEESVTYDLSFERTVIDGVTAVSSGIAVGSVIWAIRGGVLLSGLLAQMPVWTMLDPLMIIDGVASEEGDSIQDIVDRQNDDHLDNLDLSKDQT